MKKNIIKKYIVKTTIKISVVLILIVATYFYSHSINLCIVMSLFLFNYGVAKLIVLNNLRKHMNSIDVSNCINLKISHSLRLKYIGDLYLSGVTEVLVDSSINLLSLSYRIITTNYMLSLANYDLHEYYNNEIEIKKQKDKDEKDSEFEKVYLMYNNEPLSKNNNLCNELNFHMYNYRYEKCDIKIISIEEPSEYV